MKLGILATHPIQYHAPLFRDLARRDGIDLTIYFCHHPTAEEQGAGFGVAFEWDIDLTSGFKHMFLMNVSTCKTKGFFGYDTPEIADIIRQENFDCFIVHGWAWKSCWQAFRACWKTHTKLGVRSDSQLPQAQSSNLKSFIKKLLKRMVYPLFIKRFDLCLPYGQRSAEYFRHYCGRNIVVAPHFVDNEFFASQASELLPQLDELRKQWNIPVSAFCFLFCGKFQPKKRPMDILKALELLIGKGEAVRGKMKAADERKPQPSAGSESTQLSSFIPQPSMHLLMVGDGELRTECEAFAKDHDLPVTFAGFLNQSEIAEAYVLSDCLVLASESTETWGLVVNEAMACGRPAIVSDACGCMPDLIVDGRTGYSFEHGLVEGLKGEMEAMVAARIPDRMFYDDVQSHIRSYSIKNSAESILSALVSVNGNETDVPQ